MRPFYEHAGITIWHSDWRDIPLSRADVLLTDPPYGIGEAAGKNKTRSMLAVSKDYGCSEWDSQPPSADDIEHLRRISRWQMIWGGNYFHLPPSSCWLVWDKVNGANDFADCELAWTNLEKAVRKYEYQWHGMLRQNPEKRFHPTQKPLALMQWCLTHTPKAQSLLDPYMGSGTALVAAKLAGMTAVGCDREERYCAIAAERLGQEVFNFEATA